MTHTTDLPPASRSLFSPPLAHTPGALFAPAAALLLAVSTLVSTAGCGAGKASRHSRSAQPSSHGHAAEAAPQSVTSSDHSGHSGADVYQPNPTPTERPGLGTEFGERRESRIERTRFVRASQTPTAMLALHYNDAEGVRAQLDHHHAELSTARTYAGGGDVTVTIEDEDGRPLAGGAAGDKVYVVGSDGARYTIEIRNDTRYRLEIVASVDGLDVIDGNPASPQKRGYIIQPFATVRIDGFRTSDNSVAAFRFGAVRDSYAAKTSGDRNVGVIGMAIFSERGSAWTLEEIRRRETADPFPGYAKPPIDMAN